MTSAPSAPPKTLEEMPSPRGLPILGDALDFVGKAAPWDVMLDYARNYSPISRVDLPGSAIVLVSDPDAITQIMVTSASDFYKKSPSAALRPVSTDEGDIFTQPGGAIWAARKASNPLTAAMQGDWLQKVLPSMQSLMASRVDSWIGRQFSHTYDELLHMAFDAFSVMMFGKVFDGGVYRDWVAVASALDARMKSKNPFLSDSLTEEAQATQDRIQAHLEDAVRAGQATPGLTGTDLLSHALNAGCDHSSSLLATELANLYYGGIVSGSTAVATTLYLLGKSDGQIETVASALRALGPEPDPAAILGCAELQAAVLEAMRLLPPVSLWTRNVRDGYPVVVGGYVLPAGTTVMIGNRFAHTHPGHWDDADMYRPERWTAERRASDPPGSAYFFPFGRGERTCFAQDVGLAYIHLAVGTILLRSRPEVGLGAAMDQDFWFGCMVPKALHAAFGAVRG
jgi:cytochrome P450